MRGAMVVLGAVVLAGGVAWFVVQGRQGVGTAQPVGSGATPAAGDAVAPGSGSGPESGELPTIDQQALAELRAELSKAEPVSFRSDEQRLEDARAWVAANREPGRPYNEIEAQILALMDVLLDGKERSAEWIMNASQIEIEMIRALDADGDGQVSDEEVVLFIDENVAGMFNPMEHPYLQERFDTNGDGELAPEEMAGFAAAMNEGAMAGAFERGRLEAWDTDHDGVMSDGERVAGEQAAVVAARDMYSAMIGEEGTKALFGDPALSAEEQAAARATLAEQIGADQMQMIDAQRDMMLAQVTSQALLEAMRLDNLPSPDVKEIMAQMPQPPDAASFDADGDGSFSDEETAAQAQAMADYQEEIAHWGSELTAFRLQAQFENAVAQSDTDADGRMNPSEWEQRIDDLLYQRDARLYLRSYDLDGSGRVEGGELVTYLEWYRDGSLRADVNYDGRLDAIDLEAMARNFQGQGG